MCFRMSLVDNKKFYCHSVAVMQFTTSLKDSIFHFTFFRDSHLKFLFKCRLYVIFKTPVQFQRRKTETEKIEWKSSLGSMVALVH